MPSIFARDRRKQAAWVAVQRAIARGGLVAPAVCDCCGADGPLVPHHDDYSRPLDVRWLTRRCHRAYHFAERMALRAAEARA